MNKIIESIKSIWQGEMLLIGEPRSGKGNGILDLAKCEQLFGTMPEETKS